jgi:hypothetical protein
VNNFPYWINFKFDTDLELTILKYKTILKNSLNLFEFKFDVVVV